MSPITLPIELQNVIDKRAGEQGTTPELLIVNTLRNQFLPTEAATKTVEVSTMAEFFQGYLGGLHSSEFVPGGANASEETGRKYKELLLKNHNLRQK